MKDKNIEIKIKVPRVRISDCQRLTFYGGDNIRWTDISEAPEIYPVYPLPRLSRKTYFLGDRPIDVAGKDINAVIREVCKAQSGDNLDRCFLHTLVFMKDGNLQINYEII